MYQLVATSPTWWKLRLRREQRCVVRGVYRLCWQSSLRRNNDLHAFAGCVACAAGVGSLRKRGSAAAGSDQTERQNQERTHSGEEAKA